MRLSLADDRRRVFLLLAMRNAMRASGAETLTVTGVSPLALLNAVAHGILSLTQYGKCTESGGKTYCNNGEVKASPNLLDSSAANTTLGKYIEKTTGNLKDAKSNFMFEAYMPVVGGKTYVAYGKSWDGTDIADYNRIAWYDSNKDWISGANYTQNQISVVTAPANAAYARFSCNPSGGTSTEVTQELVDSFYWVFQEGTAEPSAVHAHGEVWVEGNAEVLTVSADGVADQTASVVSLFAADGVADEQDIITGLVMRRVAVSGDGGVLTMAARVTPTTESVTPQALHTVAGTTVVTVEAEVDGITLAVEYKGVAAEPEEDPGDDES